MEAANLSDLHKAFFAVHRTQANIQSEIRLLKAHIGKLKARFDAMLADAERDESISRAASLLHEVNHQQHLLNKRPRRQTDRQEKKMKQRVRRRDAYRQAARLANPVLAWHWAEITYLEAVELPLLLVDLDRYRASTRYYERRHGILRDIAEAERGDAEARHRKRRLMKAAKISRRFRPEEVWWLVDRYEDGVEEVDLFVGGEESPTGEGKSPDGLGHGHYVLACGQDDKIRVLYGRHPKPSAAVAVA